MKVKWEWVGTSVAGFLTAIQTEHIFQIISLILTCICCFITILYNLYKWYKEAIKDGKISQEERNKLKEIVEEGIEDLTPRVNATREEIKKYKGDKKC